MKRRTIVLATLVATMSALPALAQWRTDSGDTDGDRPSTGVARVSLADGDVEVQRSDSGDRIQARGGMPLLATDSIVTGTSSRAEVQFGDANFIRLSSAAKLTILDLGNRFFRVEVVSGSVTYSQLTGGEAEMYLDTPQASVRPLKKGVYRVSVREVGQTDVTVRKGEAEIALSRGQQVLRKGRRMSIRGEGDDAELQFAKASERDGFDQWTKRRNKLLSNDPRYRRFGWPYAYSSLYYPYWGYGYGYRPWGLGYGGGIAIYGGGRGGHRGRGRGRGGHR